MTTQASIGHSSQFMRDDGTGNFVKLSEVVNITPPNLTRDTPDASHMDSTDRYRDFISGMRDGDEVTIEMNFIPGGSGITALLVDYNDDDFKAYKIVFPNAVEWQFNAFITSFNPDAPLDDKMTLGPTFKITGKPVLA